MLLARRVPLPKEQPTREGDYNVFVFNYGLNSDGQALEGSRMRIVGGTERNSVLASQFQRCGFRHYGTTAEFLKKLQDSTVVVDTVHVLSVQCGVQPLHVAPGQVVDDILDRVSLDVQLAQVLAGVKLLIPSVVLIRLPMPDMVVEGQVQSFVDLETQLVELEFDVTVEVVNSAEFGDFVAKHEYLVVGVKSATSVSFRAPAKCDVFSSISPILLRPATVMPKFRAREFQAVETGDVGEFHARRIGTVVRGATAQLGVCGLYDLSHPLPEIGPSFAYNGVHGGQWIKDAIGPRLLYQQEMAKGCNFDTETQNFLLNEDKRNVQRYLAYNSTVGMLAKLYQAVLAVLVKVTAADNSPLGHSVSSKEEVVAGIAETFVSTAFPSAEQLLEEQTKEEDIAVMVEYLSLPVTVRRSTKKPSSVYMKDLQFLRVHAGLLFYRHEIAGGTILTDAVVLPKSLKAQVLRALHDSPFYGHPGERATRVAIVARCYWAPHMVKDIKSYVKRCLGCTRSKAFRRNYAGLPKRQIFLSRNECQQWDLVGPFVEVDGFCYILHGTNPCTGFNYCMAVANKETLTVARGMHEEFMRSGWPQVVVTDNGGEFCSKLQTCLAEQFGYKHIKCCPKSPNGNTFVEGRHKQVNAFLKVL